MKLKNQWLLASILAIATVGIVSYFTASRIGFVNNDWYYLDQVARLNANDYLALYFDPRLQSGWYRPLFGMLYWIVYAFWGASTAAHHWAHVVLHLANGLLLLALIRRFTFKARLALLASLIYVGLPVYSKAVYWISVPDPLSVFFGLIALWFWINFLEREKRRDYVFAFTGFALALITKEASITIPAVFFLVDRLLVRRAIYFRALILRYAPFALAILPYLLIELSIQQNGVWVNVAGYGIGAHMLTNLFNALAWSASPIELPTPFNYFWLAVVVVGLAVWMVRQRDERVAFLACLAPLQLLPTIGFQSTWFEPRYTYTASMAFAILFAAVADRVVTLKPRVAVQVLASAMIAWIVLSNAIGVDAQVTEWGEIARQRRVPFRDILRAHPTFPPNTYIYFLESPVTPLYDLSVMFLLQYGKGMKVEGVDDNQPARWNDFANAYLYYFDSTGKPIEIAVERADALRAAPELPVRFAAPIQLEGLKVPKARAARGEPLILVLDWRAAGKLDEDYTVFVHLVNER
ncbi:MAG: glycosyltransferase family 39 protein, partial [Chloroflexi bacterium]|nr:glycosyltransferase family 39 protein [Chloroflexota bacterium]